MNDPRLLRDYKGEFGAWHQKEAQKSVEKFDDVIVIDGIPRWSSNGRIPPSDLLLLWNYVGKDFDLLESLEQLDFENSEALEAYRESQKNKAWSDEELYEMRAAFGTGVSVLDVLTGQRVQL